MAVSYHGIYENSIQIRTATGDNSMTYCPAVHISFPQQKITAKIIIISKGFSSREM